MPKRRISESSAAGVPAATISARAAGSSARFASAPAVLRSTTTSAASAPAVSSAHMALSAEMAPVSATCAAMPSKHASDARPEAQARSATGSRHAAHSRASARAAPACARSMREREWRARLASDCAASRTAVGTSRTSSPASAPSAAASSAPSLHTFTKGTTSTRPINWADDAMEAKLAGRADRAQKWFGDDCDSRRRQPAPQALL